MNADATTDMPDESTRQRELDRYRVVDSLPDAIYDDVVRLAATICDVPIALLTIVDRDRQWFKSRFGTDIEGTPRDVAFCDYAIRDPGRLMEVPDTLEDARFVANPLVTGAPGVRFYAGMPLVTPEGAAIGTVCVIDDHPRELSATQRDALAALARLAMQLLDAHRREHERHVEATLAKAETTLAPPPSPAPRTVVVLELQDMAGAAARLGERGVERALLEFEHTLASVVDTDAGDSVSRVTGSGELIGVLHGDDAGTTLQKLHDAHLSLADARGLRFVTAAAVGTDDEPLTAAFLRAEAALSDAKDAARPWPRAA